MLIWLAIRTAKSLREKLIWQNVDMLNSFKILYILFIPYYLKCEIHKDMWTWTGTALPICHSMMSRPIKTEILILSATSEHPVTYTAITQQYGSGHRCVEIICLPLSPMQQKFTWEADSLSPGQEFFCLLRNCPQNPVIAQYILESSWNVMAHSDAREGKWRGNWRMEWVASTLHTTSAHGVSSITTADARTSAASSHWTDAPPI
jgi:hypothetical protein